MRNSVMYQLAIDDYRDSANGDTCESWQGWTQAMVDGRAVNGSTVAGWPCPNCNRKGCAGEARQFLPLPSAYLPTRYLYA